MYICVCVCVEMIPTPDVEEETFRSLLSSVQNNMDRLENNGGADTLEDLCALVSLLQSCLKFLTGADHTDCYTRTMMGSYHLFQSVYHTIDTKVIHNQDNRELTEEAYGLLRELGINDGEYFTPICILCLCSSIYVFQSLIPWTIKSMS